MTKTGRVVPSGWTRVVVSVPAAEVPGEQAARVELAADRLWGFGPAAVEERTGGTTVVLLAGYADEATARAAAAAADAAGDGPATVVPVDDDGLDGWRAWARPHRAGPFLVVPTWLAATTGADAGAGADADRDRAGAPPSIRLVVDPGHTFGSGSHPTTRLVLARLAELVRPGDRVLDVGCGSGILAIGAALLGAGRVEGLDVDTGAPAAVVANAAANGVADRVSASTLPLSEAGGTFAVVAANLLAPVVAALATDLARVVEPGGALVVSGLLADRWPDGVAPVRAADPRLQVEDVATDDGWAAVTLRG